MANLMRRLAASSVVALAFSPLAQAGGLIDDNNAVNSYRPTFSTLMAKVTGDDNARGRARGFMSELETALKAPADSSRLLVYPKENSTNMLVVAAVVPPKGYESLPIPVCAQQNNKVLGTWQITNKGEVLPVTPVFNPEGSTKAACNAFIIAARSDINQRVAEAEAKKSGQTAGLSVAPVVANSNNGSLRPALQ